MTLSMTWMMPLEVSVLGFTTVASLIVTLPPLAVIFTIAPLTVLASPTAHLFRLTAPGTT